MPIRQFLIFCFLTIIPEVYSQIVVSDVNKNPIPFVEVFSNNKHFYSQTNSSGKISLDDFKKLQPKDTLFFQLFSFETLTILFEELNPNDTVFMNERILEIEEFSIVANKEKPKYQKIDFCYRSYQFNDDSVAYYLDGKADYTSKVNKDRFDLHLKENRFYANKVIEDNIPERTVGVTFRPSVPRPPYDYLPYYFDKKNKLTYSIVDSSKVVIYGKDNIYVGFIEEKGGFVKYVISDNHFVGTNNLFNSEVHRLKREITLVFRKSELFDIKSKKNFEDLLYYKSNRELNAKHDKDKNFTNVILVEEFFVEAVSYHHMINTQQYDASLRRYSTNYSSEFWKSCDCAIYQEPNKYLLKNLEMR